ncbi:MAG: 3-hexulose-6-phosphate synthase [Planctomycetes bacterium]|nr:3-hexulose-6-phosphate synthase [Planctomycetota bacterium]
MKLQLAFDFLELAESEETIREVHDLIDIVEIGTPLIIREGIRAVSRIRSQFPSLEILADLKIMDGGQYESKLAFEAGADIVTVLALADNVTIEAAVKEAQSRGKIVVADMIGVEQTEKRALEIEELGVSYLCLHTAIDVQFKGEDALEQLKRARQVLKRAGTAVAGGISLQTIAEVVAAGPDIVVVGSGITKQRNKRAAVLEIKSIMS